VSPVTNLVFLEDRAQVLQSKQALPLCSGTKLIAVTAEALEALEEYDLPHEAVSAYANARDLVSVDEQLNLDCFSLAQEIETFIGQRYSGARFDGPGFISGQAYVLQYSASAILTRAFLMRETIRACSPEKVVVFAGEIDPWFIGDGYARNPWLNVTEQLAAEQGFKLDVLPYSNDDQRSLLENLRIPLRRGYDYARRKVHRLIRQVSLSLRPPRIPLDKDLKGLRLLMVDGHSYDWAPVLSALRNVKGVEGARLHCRPLDGRFWTFHFGPSLQRLWSRRRHELGVESPRIDAREIKTVSTLFDDWLRQRPTQPALTALGINVFPAIASHLRAMATLGPALTRHADAVSSRALYLVKPHAVCFFAMPWLVSKRLAFYCHQQGIPVVCYQHGGAYGTQVAPKNELIEPAHADYFLVYGRGIQPRANPAFLTRARYVPVGSARIAIMKAKAPPSSSISRRVINVLWIGEISLRNTVGGTFQVEDTERYLLQKECLEILDRGKNLRVTYRPYPGREQWNSAGTTRWLERVNPRSIVIDSSLPLEKLIGQHDLVITDCSSNTAWNEVLALGRPLIVYCDPEQTPLTAAYMEDLDEACHWCRTREAIVVAVRKLVLEGETFLSDLRKKESSAYLRKYVVHERPDASVKSVISFLNSVCRRRQPVEEWERETPDTTT
jgi:hypothetical protein